MDFLVLVIGTDANAYYMGRCYHEKYNKEVYLLGREYRAFTKYSDIFRVIYDDKIWTEEGLLNALYNFRKKFKKQIKILLIPTNETYVRFISKNREILKKDFCFNVPEIKIIDSLINKEIFYKTYKESILEFPKTIYYDLRKDELLDTSSLRFPLIIKPANVILYNHIEFPLKNKIYKVENLEVLNEIIDRIKASDYKDILIIQEFIPGDDTYLYDAVIYVSKCGEVKVISFAEILLQEQTEKMVGNAAVLINGYNYHSGNTEEMINKLKNFVLEIGYTGFCEVDMKYDYRDKSFKVLEINARQGRCSYYINQCGINLVSLLIDDVIYNKDIPYRVLNEDVLLSFVPKIIVRKYIKNKEIRKDILKRWKCRVNPLKYKNDKNLYRKILLLKIDYNYLKDYRNSYFK